MTAVSLFDVMARQETGFGNAAKTARLAALASRLVQEAREEYRRLREYEQEFGQFTELEDRPYGDRELELLRSIWRMFDRWAETAEEVLGRADQLAAVGETIPHLEQLRDDYGAVRARLSVTPEQIMHADHQAQNGETFTAKELRDELRARLHG
jgi:hypothetical protein